MQSAQKQRSPAATRLYPGALRLGAGLVVGRQLDAPASAAQHRAAVPQVGHEHAAAEQQRHHRRRAAVERLAAAPQRLVCGRQPRALRAAGVGASAAGRGGAGCCGGATASEAAAETLTRHAGGGTPRPQRRACARGRDGNACSAPAAAVPGAHRGRARTIAAGTSAGKLGWLTMASSRCSRAYTAAARPPWPSNTCVAAARSAARRRGPARDGTARGRGLNHAHAPRRSRTAGRQPPAPPRHQAPRRRLQGRAGRRFLRPSPREQRAHSRAGRAARNCRQRAARHAAARAWHAPPPRSPSRSPS